MEANKFQKIGKFIWTKKNRFSLSTFGGSSAGVKFIPLMQEKNQITSYFLFRASDKREEELNKAIFQRNLYRKFICAKTKQNLVGAMKWPGRSKKIQIIWGNLSGQKFTLYSLSIFGGSWVAGW